MKKLGFFLAFTLCVATINAQNTQQKAGKCNGDVEWHFDGRTLTISNISNKDAYVDIPDYDLKNNIAPWVKKKLSIKKVVIKQGIKRIGSCAFANCEELIDVQFRSTHVGEIGWGAFYNCKSLFSISIPVYVKRIETIAFAKCSSLPSIKIPALASVGEYAFSSCDNLNLIDIGDDVVLGKDVFTTEVKENDQMVRKFYSKEIRSLPSSVNANNCTEFGLDADAVAVCLERMAPSTKTPPRQTLIDTDIPEALFARTDTYALIIGNQKYRFVGDVPLANNDAEVFYRYCIITLGIPTANVHLCEDATKSIILDEEIGDWLKQSIPDKADKKLIVYYAGHGVPDLHDNNKSYILPTDVRGSKPYLGISLDSFYETLGSLGFDLVTVFIDACFSGLTRDSKSINNEERAVEVEAKDVKPSTGKLIAFTAAQRSETAQSYQDECHGLFTYYLLKELRETHGQITYGNLDKNIRKHVQEVAPTLDLHKSQTPSTVTSWDNSLWKNFTF